MAIGSGAIEFYGPAVYTEKFNFCTKQANLDDPAVRHRIAAFVRALITAAHPGSAGQTHRWRVLREARALTAA